MALSLESVRSPVAKRLHAGKLELPVLPAVAAELLSIVDDEGTDAARVSRLIHQDAGLAANVLRVANGAQYRGVSQIVSLQQAVARLGVGLITEIAVAVSVRGSVFSVRAHGDLMQRLWSEALGTGQFAKEVARLLRTNVESAFLCGLLHGVGAPAILRAVIKNKGRRLDRAAIETIIDDLAPEAGSFIAEKWRLPSPVVASIQHHRDHAAATSHQREVCITVLARELALHALEPPPPEGHEASDDAPDPADRVREHTVVEALNLYPEDVESLLAKVDEVRGVVGSMGAAA